MNKVKIKFCGITQKQDFDKAVSLKTDFIGFIFYQKSPRYVTPETVTNFTTGELSPLKVGVFVNEEADKVKEIFERCQLDIVQLHGEETPEYCTSLKLPYWKVIRMKNENSLSLMADYSTNTFLLDTFVKDLHGGTGKTFNLDFVSVKDIDQKIILSGGINIKNLSTYLDKKPFALDISSGIESQPGIKDHHKMEQIIELIKKF